ncbi:DUF1963 domain-containing protein [Nonomuraea sp. NPDC049269]|uniref:DUF1963 domain-containing protein n=1 Tax=Nonomuraea sp. NPDC049269 TaxID=3364349 RepID=UPI00371A411E
MDQQSTLAEVRELCIQLLGERLGQQMAALAQPGFVLKPSSPDMLPAGRSRAGGPALLEPGTPWPQATDGAPLSLFAVLDTDELAPSLGDRLPARLGLVNVFKAVRWGIDECTIICADPAHAVETPTPARGEVLTMVELHAAPIITLPSVSGEYGTGDPVLETFDYRAEPGYDEDHWESPTERFVQGPLREEWHYYCRDRQGFAPGDSQVFGWPHIDSWIGMRADGYHHFLTLSGDLWNDNGFERVMVPPGALQTGKFTNVVCEQDGLH